MKNTLKENLKIFYIQTHKGLIKNIQVLNKMRIK